MQVQGEQGLAFPGVSMPSWQGVGKQGKARDKATKASQAT